MLTRVEKYKISEEIGHGGMATVYRARDTRLDRYVALKVMHPHLQSAQEARTRFAREALSVARLKHPGILEIYDYSGEDSEVCYIATELLTGPTLKRFVEENPDIPAEIAACFTVALARALGVAHAQGVIHRDVKPENVLLHENREVKLTDFGIAQLVDAQSMTTTGQVLGSPGHMAPEQVEGKECGVRSDLFSLGTVLYLLSTGRLPFAGRNPHQVLKQIVDGRFIDPLVVKPSIGKKLSDIINRCLQVDPEKRYQSASDLEEDLTAFVKQIGIEAPIDMLAEYLSDPKAVASSIHVKTLEFLIQAGERLRVQGNLTEALECFNRALALDEGNEQVLSSLDRIGRHSRLRRMLWSSVATISILIVVILIATIPNQLWASLLGRTEVRKKVKLPEPEEKPPLEKQQNHKPPTEQPKRNSHQKPEIVPAEKPKQRRKRIVRKKPETLLPETEISSRRVVFKPFPANVSISVNGDKPRAFGPSFYEIDLLPGEHTFKFIGAHECCIDQEFKVEIPPGPGTTTIKRSLSYRPAGLYVVSDVPANVSVDGGKIKGRSRSVLQVPHRDSLIEIHRITVTAKGYKDYKQNVQLQAGRVVTVDIVLDKIQGE